jgi:hypothetical protein
LIVVVYQGYYCNFSELIIFTFFYSKTAKI